MKITHNIQALRAMNDINRIHKKNTESLAKLSSGLAINKAADDAAGLSISEGMRAQIRGLLQAGQNIQDAESLLHTAEGVLGGVTDLLQRMRELTIQSLNDTLTDSDRTAIQQEFKQLQLSVDRASDQAQWSGMSVIDSHSPSFSKVEGNHIFSPAEAVRIIDGYNNDLEIVVDGVSRKITIPEGEYEPVEVLVDYLDDILIDLDQNLIVHLTENRAISIQAENNKSIDRIAGGASFLLYEYTLGNPPGMIIGVTQFKEGGKVESIPGVSDKLSFYVGSDRPYTIQFARGFYSRDEAIEEINRQLAEKGERDVRAIPHGNERIALTSNKHVITGLGGNMIEIDNVTSLLYDNRKKGSISKTQAYVSGYASLTNGITMKAGVNDELTVYIEGRKADVHFLEGESEKHVTSEEIVSKINAEFERIGIKANAAIRSGQLEIRSDYYGTQSQVIVDKQSSAYEKLFVRHTTTYQFITPRNGAENHARFQGNYGVGDSTTLTADNNILMGSVNGVDFSIELEAGNYSKQELIDALNELAKDLELEFALSAAMRAGKSAVVVSHTEAGNNQFTLNTNSSLFPVLMNGITINEPFHTAGRTDATYPPEGIAAPPTYEYIPATATGRSPLAGITITGDNNVMTFRVNGEAKEVHLLQGTYQTADAFLAAHQPIFDAEGLIASTNMSNALVLTTKEAGDGKTLNSFGGSSHEFIMGNRVEQVPFAATARGSVTLSEVKGVYRVPNNLEINNSNNVLSFTYSHEGTSYELEVELDQTTYVNAVQLAHYLDEKVENTLREKGLNGDEIEVKSNSDGTLSIVSKGDGSKYSFSNPQGNLFAELFQKRVTRSEPIVSRSGSTHEVPTYIVGRDSLSTKEVVIHPHVNDRLLLDFHVNGSPQTIELKLNTGSYTSSSLVQELNRSLLKELESMGHFPDLIKAQIGGVSSNTSEDDSDKLVFKVNRKDDGRNDAGSYMIDGIRGSAAYSFFYQAQGEPAPTYAIGVVDLSNGAVIEEGKNDTFIFNVDGVEKKVILSAGDYSADALLKELNDSLETANASVVASIFEGRLKLSSIEVGQISIDGLRGNARGTLFFEESSREEDREWNFQIGANSGDSLTMNKIRASAKLLRVNTLMVDDVKRAEKALQRLDGALGKVSEERSRIGAVTNRLGHSMAIARQTAENLIRSESKIRDADIAKEMMQKVKSDILLQSSQFVLSHANANPKNILELLH